MHKCVTITCEIQPCSNFRWQFLGSKSKHMPFRNSQFTFILQTSLGPLNPETINAEFLCKRMITR